MTSFPQELWFVLAGHAISICIILGIGIFILTQKSWRNTENRLFLFVVLGTFVNEIVWMLASTQPAHSAAYFLWWLNIIPKVFIAMLSTHFIVYVSGRAREWCWFIRLSYALGLLVIVVACIMPHWYLVDVVPKLYFPYYPVSGWWFNVFLLYFFTFPAIAAISLFIARQRFPDAKKRRQFEYFLFSIAYGYCVGSISFLFTLNIPIDPVFSVFYSFYLLPIAYGIFSADLFDIRIVARRAFYYALSIGSITAFLVALVLFNSALERAIPWLQFWMVPLFVALVAFVVGRLVLWQFRESERLKYEFITVATHELRTPLTRIRWSIPELINRAGADQEMRAGLMRINEANNQLIELTNALVEVSHSGTVAVIKKEPIDLRPLADQVLEHFKTAIAAKQLTISINSNGTTKALGEERSVSSMIDALIENAVSYTPTGGSIRLRIAPDEHGVRFSVADSGIGIAPEHRENIFSGFFRTDAARSMNTAGLGLGLSLVKSITERLDGSIGFDSPGVGRGSTFWFVLPKA
ncbi:MAG: ATP-binding protein [Minisyncoccia bacterium]|jgi:signal transduction histidine kinase